MRTYKIAVLITHNNQAFARMRSEDFSNPGASFRPENAQVTQVEKFMP